LNENQFTETYAYPNQACHLLNHLRCKVSTINEFSLSDSNKLLIIIRGISLNKTPLALTGALFAQQPAAKVKRDCVTCLSALSMQSDRRQTCVIIEKSIN
jgi:hypothetical protein